VLPEGSAEWLLARSGRRLRVARFLPPGPVRGSVVLSPGRTEPIEKYGEVAGALLSRGFAVLTHDWAGQGLSQRFLSDRLRGDVDGGFAAFLADFSDVVSAYAGELPRPWIAVGHSMGGALTALALTEVPASFDGAVLCAPMMMFSTGAIPPWAARRLVAGAMRLGIGKRLVRGQVDPVKVPFEDNVLTHDRARYERSRVLYRAHPELCIGEPTWRWLKFGVDLGDRLASPGAAEGIRCPVTLLAAGADLVVHNAAIHRFARRIPRGRYVGIPGAFHEILMEIDAYRDRFFEEFDRLAADLAKVEVTSLAAS
jgi:lysophospholipase